MAATTHHHSSTGNPHGSRRLGALLRDFPWVHLGIGLLGNSLFFAGSILFFWKSTMLPAIWIFVFGSLGMLIGSLGELLVRVEKRRHGDD
ncbi:YrhK-like protein [Modestobacter sp. DSM 44400]|uniref:YrhK family protein n=1 Tax=Modestobacter sp. DSM 44400 TaxID=1550230 RepID=UPI00089A2AC5|nr:YrhK family protein [Modestobacter sp. DSM 44400]SDY10727.1 YrhK-like protein [Modestobacter sp. DSM 44400]